MDNDSVFSFSANTYAVNESGGSATVTINRTGALVDAQGKALTKEPDWSTHFTTDLL